MLIIFTVWIIEKNDSLDKNLNLIKNSTCLHFMRVLLWICCAKKCYLSIPRYYFLVFMAYIYVTLDIRLYCWCLVNPTSMQSLYFSERLFWAGSAGVLGKWLLPHYIVDEWGTKQTQHWWRLNRFQSCSHSWLSCLCHLHGMFFSIMQSSSEISRFVLIAMALLLQKLWHLEV